jgi:glutamine amidotransferase
MTSKPGIQAAIVDYGLGNLFSVKNACEHAGMQGVITSTKEEILAADVVVLPGVGAFGDAMEALRRLDLVTVLQHVGASDPPLVGICLGMQLLMSESQEFGTHKGLGIVAGDVVRFDNPVGEQGRLKVPQVGWTRIVRAACSEGPRSDKESEPDAWLETPLGGLADGEYMYFVHSLYVRPQEQSVSLSVTRYGDIEFCSSLASRNIFACQFHPERSGPRGLRIYENVAALAGKLQEKFVNE